MVTIKITFNDVTLSGEKAQVAVGIGAVCEKPATDVETTTAYFCLGLIKDALRQYQKSPNG